MTKANGRPIIQPLKAQEQDYMVKYVLFKILNLKNVQKILVSGGITIPYTTMKCITPEDEAAGTTMQHYDVSAKKFFNKTNVIHSFSRSALSTPLSRRTMTIQLDILWF